MYKTLPAKTKNRLVTETRKKEQSLHPDGIR